MPKAAPPADTAPPPRPRRALSYVDSLTPHLFVPSAERPVRAKVRQLAADTQVMPHSHQLHPAKEPMVAIPEKSRIKLCVDCHSKQHEVVKAAKANTTSGKEAP